MSRNTTHMKRFVIIGLLLSLTACKSFWGGDDEEDDGPYKGQTAKQLFTDSSSALAKKDYSGAIKRMEALETLYPFNDYAEQAEINLIYAYYKKEDYPSAAATAERFIHLYPRAKRVDYAYYMKALANFQQVRGAVTAMLSIDESWRDPGTQSQAYSDFATLVQKFPESRYKANALQRMIYLSNMFAQRRMYVAATERANYLVKTYTQAPSAKEALSIIYYGNKALGLKQAAADAKQVYQATYHSAPSAVALD